MAQVKPVIRVDGKTHAAVAEYAKACGDEVKMTDVIDRIIAAGIKALASDEATAIETPAPTETTGALDADAHLREAFDAETLRLVRERRNEVANRARGAEKKTLVETAQDMILVAWNRIAAIQKDAAKRKAA